MTFFEIERCHYFGGVGEYSKIQHFLQSEATLVLSSLTENESTQRRIRKAVFALELLAFMPLMVAGMVSKADAAVEVGLALADKLDRDARETPTPLTLVPADVERFHLGRRRKTDTSPLSAAPSELKSTFTNGV